MLCSLIKINIKGGGQMATPVTGEKIILNFGWQGPSSWHGRLDVGVVDLIFKNAKTDISVHIPSDIAPTTVQQFPFTCRKYQESEVEISGRKFKPLLQETHPDSLRVTTEQIHNLRIKAGIFEESPRKGLTMMDRSGQITTEKRLLRSDREVKLKMPEELEIGQTYRLVITSNDLSLEARLVKEEKVTVTPSSTREDDTQLLLDQAELFQLLGGVLLPVMGVKMMEFGVMLASTPSCSSLTFNPDFSGQTLGIEAIKSEIRKIETGTLKELMTKIRTSKAEWESKSSLERDALEKELFKSVFNTIVAKCL